MEKIYTECFLSLSYIKGVISWVILGLKILPN